MTEGVPLLIFAFTKWRWEMLTYSNKWDSAIEQKIILIKMSTIPYLRNPVQGKTKIKQSIKPTRKNQIKKKKHLESFDKV